MTENSRGTSLAFAFVTMLFFAWGFATSLIDALVAAVRHVFALSFTEAFLTTFAWFIAYGVASLPAAAVLARLGYSRAIVAALGVMVAGCLLIPLAGSWYPGVLVALFVIASGVTLLQVAANPLVAKLGAPDRSSFRLSFSQGFNSLGTTVAPWVGAHLLLTGGVFAPGAVITDATRGESIHGIALAFVGLGAFFAVVAALLFSARRHIDAAAPASTGEASSPLQALRAPWAIVGAIAIFVYVGSEVTIGSTLTNFLAADLAVPLDAAGKMVAYYWGGAMVGRFVGSAVLTRVAPAKVLLVCTAVAAVLCVVVTQAHGASAAWVALSIGLFNSIMFPSIFGLTLERSSASTSATSGLLVFGIIGGALTPQAAGLVADKTGNLGLVFFVPLAGYVLLVLFALACVRTPPRAGAFAAPAPAAAGH